MDAIAGPCGALARGLRSVVTRSVLDTLARCFSHEVCFVLHMIVFVLRSAVVAHEAARSRPRKRTKGLMSSVACAWSKAKAPLQPHRAALFA